MRAQLSVCVRVDVFVLVCLSFCLPTDLLWFYFLTSTMDATS